MFYIDSKYQVLRSLGTGAVGEVYLAKDLTQDKSPLVALKLLKFGKESDKYLKEFFQREVGALKQLSHPGIVSYYHSGYDEEEKAYYLVLEYVEGDTLEKFVSDEPLECDDAVEIIIALLESLSYAHSKGIFHRDIKPTNILVDMDRKIKLADFGVSKVYTVLTSGLTVRDFLSIPYASPEQLQRKPADAKTDIYLSGAVFYKLLTGKDPVTDQSLETLVVSDTNIPNELQTILTKMIASDLSERFETANKAKIALKTFLNSFKKSNIKHYLAVTNAAINRLFEYGFIRQRDELEAKKFLEQELSGSVKATYDLKFYTYYLIGRQLKLICKQDEKTRKHLVLTTIHLLDDLNLERDRERGIEIYAKWNVIKDSLPPADYNVRYFLDDLVSKSVQEENRKQTELSHKDMISEWEKVLNLHRKEIQEAERAINYYSKDLSIDGDYLEINIGAISEVFFNEDQPLLITRKGLTRYIHVGYFQDINQRMVKTS